MLFANLLDIIIDSVDILSVPINQLHDLHLKFLKRIQLDTLPIDPRHQFVHLLQLSFINLQMSNLLQYRLNMQYLFILLGQLLRVVLRNLLVLLVQVECVLILLPHLLIYIQKCVTKVLDLGLDLGELPLISLLLNLQFFRQVLGLTLHLFDVFYKIDEELPNVVHHLAVRDGHIVQNVELVWNLVRNVYRLTRAIYHFTIPVQTGGVQIALPEGTRLLGFLLYENVLLFVFERA